MIPGRLIICGVMLLAAVVRLWFLGVPLLITNDSAGYLHWAQMILRGENIVWPVFRTPGYPLFLALVFLIGGVSPVAVLIAQHALGVAMCGLIAFASLRLAGPRMAIMAGVVASLDPWMLGFSSSALTELLSAFLLVLVLVVTMNAERATLARALTIGIVLACLVLVRPAFQVVVPTVAIGWWLAFSVRSRRSLVTAFIIVSSFGLIVSPWLWHNHQRGIRGFSGGSTMFLWIGAAGAGLLDEDYPLPEDVRTSYDKHVRPAPEGGGKYEFLGEVGAWHDEDRARLLVDWAAHSLQQEPVRWGGTFAYALGWQLGYFPRHGPITHGFSRWMLKRLTADGREHGMGAANFQFVGDWDMTRFAMNHTAGPQRHYLLVMVYYRDIGLYHGVLLAAAIAATALALFNRRWLIAAALGSTIAYYGLHAAFLLPYDRFSFPCWMAWYLSPGALVSQIRRVRNRRDQGEAASVGAVSDPSTPAASQGMRNP